MAVLFIPLIEAAVAELGSAAAAGGTALAGGAAVAGVASLSGDTPRNDSKAEPVTRSLPRTDEKCQRCPPDLTGVAMDRKHHMTEKARVYQGCITGRPYDVEAGWSEEWVWLGIDFDGFVKESCLLQEAKGDYDQFLEMPWALKSFKGFDRMVETIETQGEAVRENPPTRLMWYFQGPKTRAKMLRQLTQNGIQSVVVP